MFRSSFVNIFLPFSCSDYTQCTALCSRQGTGDTTEEFKETEENIVPDNLRNPTVLPETSGVRHCISEEQTLQGATATETISKFLPEQATWFQLSRVPSEADIPPSYSKATGLDSVGEPLSQLDGKRLKIDIPDDSTLPSLSHELTASELLRNR